LLQSSHQPSEQQQQQQQQNKTKQSETKQNKKMNLTEQREDTNPLSN
jgi:hypothetical protein